MAHFDIWVERGGVGFGSPTLAAGHEVLVNAFKRRPSRPDHIEPEVFARIVEIAPDDLTTTIMAPGGDANEAIRFYGAVVAPDAFHAELEIADIVNQRREG